MVCSWCCAMCLPFFITNTYTPPYSAGRWSILCITPLSQFHHQDCCCNKCLNVGHVILLRGDILFLSTTIIVTSKSFAHLLLFFISEIPLIVALLSEPSRFVVILFRSRCSTTKLYFWHYADLHENSNRKDHHFGGRVLCYHLYCYYL